MPRRSRLRLELILGVLALSAVWALAVPSAFAAAPEWRGVHLHSLWWESTNSDMDRELDLARDSGANVVRVDVGWSSLETGGKGNSGGWYLDKLDRLVAGASARGMKVIARRARHAVLGLERPGDPAPGLSGQLVEPRRSRCIRPPTTSDFADIAVFITRRYGTSWRPSRSGTSRTWARTASGSRPTSRAPTPRWSRPPTRASSRPTPTFRCWPAPSPTGTTPSCRACTPPGIKGHYDGLAIHPYHDGAPRPGSWGGIEWARRLQREAGDTTPLWLTEFGWSTCRIGSGLVRDPGRSGRGSSAPPSPPSRPSPTSRRASSTTCATRARTQIPLRTTSAWWGAISPPSPVTTPSRPR